ncbi:MAG: 2-phospho-L-lactate guanylyltransferase [Anaerolineales bacterium]|jgi:2-phospho-L-lactate guanylyltransferase
MSRKLWALVPVKRLADSKTRLTPTLSARERRELTRRMYLHTLETLAQAGEKVCATLVVTADEEALALARARGVDTLIETGGGGLNAALRQGTLRVADRGGNAVLVLPIDLPGLAGSVLCEALDRLPEGRVVAIAPDHQREGTNALVVSPLGLIDYRFGPGSFRAHLAAARAEGSEIIIWKGKGFAHDVDVAEDLATVAFAPLDRR